MSGLSDADSYRYRAYVSYSHHDEKWAVWLHKKLESYHVPKRLVGLDTHAGSIPKRIAPIFRDREELPTATDLGEVVNKALRDSANLIVICSPKAAASRWVNEEILTFKRLGRTDRIFCFIVAGEPNVAEHPGLDVVECFPHALRFQLDKEGQLTNQPTEPIAADARAGKDGKADAKLKLIAGIIGVGFNDLKRRELHRRQIRMTSVTATALSVMVLTTFLAVRATVAEREALHNRAQAESLINFILGDLYAKLQPIGRLDVLDAVGDKAIDYFDSVHEHSMTLAALEDRGAAMRQIGEVRMAQGRLDEAMGAYERALADAEIVMIEDPHNNDARFQLGQAQFGVAYVHSERGDLSQMQHYMQKYLETSRELVQREPQNEAWLQELSYAYTNLGIVSYTHGEAHEALQFFQSAQAIAETILAREPDEPQRKFAVAGAISWVASARSTSGDLQGALDALREEVELKTELVSADPRNTLWLRRLSLAQRRAGELLEAMGRLDEASASFAAAFEISEQLISPSVDPSNTNWQRDAAVLHAAIGRLALVMGRTDEARRQFEHHNEIVRTLLADSISKTRWRRDLGNGLILYSKALKTTGEFEAAEWAAAEAAEVLAGLLAEHPDDREAVRLLSEAYLLQGGLFASADNNEQALTARRRAIDTIDPLANGSSDYRILYVRMQALLQLDRAEEADEIVQQLRAMGFANPEFVDLCNSNGMSARVNNLGE